MATALCLASDSLAVRPWVPEAPAPAPAHGLTPENVVVEYRGRVFALALRMLNNEADAEDVTQDVLLQITRKLGDFRGDSAVMTWVHRITVNAALAYRKKRAQVRQWEVADTEDQLLENGHRGTPSRFHRRTPDQQVLNRETGRLLERAIKQLPPIYREVLVLSDVDGLSNVLIAERLGLSVAAVKSRLHRGRMLMRELLEPYFGRSCA